MKDECLICKAPLIYLNTDEEMECVVCHRKANSKTRCANGHCVCNACHEEPLRCIQKKTHPVVYTTVSARDGSCFTDQADIQDRYDRSASGFSDGQEWREGSRLHEPKVRYTDVSHTG